MVRPGQLPIQLGFKHKGFTYYLTPYIVTPGEVASIDVFVRRDETETTFQQDIGTDVFVNQTLRQA